MDPVTFAINSSRRALDAGDRRGAAHWLDRACRLNPGDPVSRLRIVSLALQLSDGRAEHLLKQLIADYPDFREPHFGLASLYLQRGDAASASHLLGALFGRISPGADPALQQLASRIAAAAGAAGWIGVSSSGTVQLALGRGSKGAGVTVRIDGRQPNLTWIARPGQLVRTAELPEEWIGCATLSAYCDGRALLGSPVALAAIRRVDGVVEALADGRLEGWASQPGDPDAIPKLRAFRDSRPDAARALLADDESVQLPAECGAISARGFRIDPRLLPGSGAVHVIGSDGRPLFGSPCYEADEWRFAAASASRVARSFPAQPRGRREPERAAPVRWRPVPIGAEQIGIARDRLRSRKCVPERAPLDVVIPVYTGFPEFRACLRSLAADRDPSTRVVVVDDATPDPRLREFLNSAARRREIVLLRHDRNRGFPAAANTGFRHALAASDRGFEKGSLIRSRIGKPVRRTRVRANEFDGVPFRGDRDVLLLNSDTRVPHGAIAALSDIAYSAPDIGSCTPFSNAASILSYPNVAADNPAPDMRQTERLHRLFGKANGSGAAELPSAVGFCTFIRRDCLAEVGLFREDVFAQGYGEENDWSIRAAQLGWRHMAALGVFVAHRSGVSFGRTRAALMRRNMRVLERLHPGYGAFAAEFIRHDPLAPARRKVDALRWAAGRREPGAVVLVTHDLGGGVERHVRERCAALRRQGLRPIVLRPAEGGAERAGTPGACIVSEGYADDYPNLRYTLPREIDRLAELLQTEGVRHIEVHHLHGHAELIAPLAVRLRVPYDVVIHDWALFCPRVNLCNGGNAYCGEPVAVEDCSACIADAGSRMAENIGVAELRIRSGALLKGARRVIAATDDGAARIERHFAGVVPLVQPWEADPPPLAWHDMAEAENGKFTVCVLGGITADKGYRVVLNCARDAARRRLPLSFVLVGYTDDDAKLLETGNVFVTGKYRDDELPGLIEAQGAQLGFLPSQWPETWCYALTWLWKAGLPVVAFALGAQAERIRRSGRGFLLPLGLAAGRINDALLQYCRNGTGVIAPPGELQNRALAPQGR